jgi:hypothetical protein
MPAEKKYYYVGFVGTDNFAYVVGNTVKEAKAKFAEHFGIKVSSLIITKSTSLAHLSNFDGLKIK